MQSSPLLTLTCIASAAVRAERFVTKAGAECGAGARAYGVSDVAAAIGEPIAAHAIGTAVVTAGAAINDDTLVESDAQGRAVTRNTGVVLGRTLQAATAAGQRIEILLLPS